MSEEFSVYWWDEIGEHHSELRFVSAQTALDRAKSIYSGPGSILGFVKRVIITDGGDFICFEWIHGKGVVFPE